MKSFIIRLSEFPNSVEWADKAYDSAKTNQWDIHFFEGVNGRTSSLDQYNITYNKKYKKTVNSFHRPGSLGCFLSHYLLWNKCVDLDESICILEHDVIINLPFPTLDFTEVLKFIKGPETKPAYIGKWWASGAGYCVSPLGAKKLIDFVKSDGAMPSDVMLNTGIVDIQFNNDKIVDIVDYNFSFTWEL
jgi:GR25 family glycosyltransferase involved in LPS biosynthesis